MKKKVLSIFLALSLALGVSLPMTTPVMAGIDYDPTLQEMDIAAGSSDSFELTMTGLTIGDYYPLLLVGFTGNKLPDSWVDADPSEFTATSTSETITVTITVPIDAELLTYATKVKYQTSASGCDLYVTVTPPVIDYIEISPSTATITAGDSQTYTATAYSGGGSWDITSETTFTIESGAGGSWAANDYTSENADTWTVTGDYDGITDDATLTVNAGPAASIEISPSTATITAGDSQAYTAEAFDAFDNSLGDVTSETDFSIDSGAGGSWVDNDYTSENADTWTVTGDYDGITDDATLTVNAGAAAYIVISPSTATITSGDNQAYTAEAFDAFDNSLGDVTSGTSFSIESGAGGSWAANDYTSENIGTWTVTGSYGGVPDATATLTVNAGAAAYIVISPSTATITSGDNQAYTAEAFDAFDNSLGDVTSGTTFSIESGAGGSWAANDYTSENIGTWTVTGEFDGVTDTATLNVSAYVLDYIIISPDTATITAGDSQTYTAEAFDVFDNSLGDVTSDTTFSIESGAGGSWSANDYTSEVAGTWTVTGEYNGKTDTAILTVITGPLDYIIISPDTATVTAGDSQAYTAEAFDAFGNSLGDVTSGTTFSIEGSAGGSWSANVYDSENAGTWTVTGEYDGKTDTAILAVTVLGLDYIIISPDTATITAGDSQAYTAEAFDAFGNSLGDVTSGTTFSIESGAGGSWSANDYTSEVAGTWTVTGEYGGKTDTAILTVIIGEPGILVLEPATAINEINTNHELIATVTDLYGNPVPGVTVTWTIEDGPGSFVSTETTTDSNGQAMAVITSDAGGTTTVKASVSETVFDTATKTWSEEPLQYFTVDFLGEITSVPMSDDGSIMEPLAAPNPDRTHWFEMEQGTRVLDDEGNIVALIEIRITDDPPLESNDMIVGATYIINPPNVTFSKPVRFTLGYGVDELPEDVSSVIMSSYETAIGWTDLEAESNVVAGVGELSTSIEESGIFAILAEVTPQETPATFALDTLRLNPSAIKFWDFLTFAIRVGEDASVIVFVTNYGGEAGTYIATLTQNGNVIATQEVTLPPGQRQVITFDISGFEPGDYVIRIGDWYAVFSSTFWINWWLIAGLAAALIVIVWAAWYYGYHKRKHKIS